MPQQIPNTGANARTLDTFKSKLLGGGVRPNFFEVELKFPSLAIDDNDVSDRTRFLVKGAALPASIIAPISVPFRGRELKIAGERTFDTWTVTVINDQDFLIRDAMEAWMQSIGQYADGSGFTNPSDYMVNAFVKQFKRGKSNVGKNIPTGSGLEVAATYKFYDIFPTNIAAIDLSYDTSDTIEEFTVEFQVQYWTPSTEEA